MAQKTWFITGTSTGLGREWALAALERGDSVAGTARDAARLNDLAETFGERMLPLALDVTDEAAVLDAVARAHAHFGRLDVVINNAGFGQNGAVEEVSAQQVRDQFDTNFFGALWVTQAALPFLREQGSGHIIQVSSVAGITAVPHLAIYSASKWALEGMSEALAGEVREFGIRVTIVEPGGYRTPASAAARDAIPITAYEPARERQQQMLAGMGDFEGDPRATRAAILAIVDADKPPMRVLLGANLLQNVEATYALRLDTWRQWEPVSVAAHDTPVA